MRSQQASPTSTPNDKEALLKAVNTASSSARNGWIFFVALLAFFFVIVLSVSHRDMLLNSPVQLPFLNIGIPLTSFFLFAPLIMALIHVRLILQHTMLAHKMRSLENLLAEGEALTGPRTHPLRQQLSTYIYTQMLGGPERVKLLNIVLQTITVGTLIVLPLLLLSSFQVVFLPYHSSFVTAWHQTILVFDALFIGVLGIGACFPQWHFWGGKIRIMSQKAISWTLPFLFSLIMVFMSLCVATLPDSNLDSIMIKTGLVIDVPVKPKDRIRPVRGEDKSNRKAFILTAKWFEGEVNYVTGKSASWFSRNLILPNLKFHPVRTKDTRLDLRGRNLRYAVLDKADLRYADMTGAKLDHASLIRANLSHALLKSANKGRSPAEVSAGTGDRKFKTTDKKQMDQFIEELKRQGYKVKTVEPIRTARKSDPITIKKSHNIIVSWRLPDESLEHTQLGRANLSKADLTGADLSSAVLEKANLTDANLTNATLENSNLRAAEMRDSVLINTSLKAANLDRARMFRARIIGADLEKANFEAVEMTYALLLDTKAQGTNFALVNMTHAWIIGTDLKKAEFHGAILEDATILDTNFSESELWGVNFGKAIIWKSKPLKENVYEFNDVKDIKLAMPPQKKLDQFTKRITSPNATEPIKKSTLQLNALFNEVRRTDWKNSSAYKGWDEGVKLAQSIDRNKFLSGWASFFGRVICMKPSTAEVILNRLMDSKSYDGWGGSVSYDLGNSKLNWATIPLPSYDYSTADDVYGMWYRIISLLDLDPALILEQLGLANCKAAQSIPSGIIDQLEGAAKSYKKRHAKKTTPAPESKPAK